MWKWGGGGGGGSTEGYIQTLPMTLELLTKDTCDVGLHCSNSAKQKTNESLSKIQELMHISHTSRLVYGKTLSQQSGWHRFRLLILPAHKKKKNLMNETAGKEHRIFDLFALSLFYLNMF